MPSDSSNNAVLSYEDILKSFTTNELIKKPSYEEKPAMKYLEEMVMDATALLKHLVMNPKKCVLLMKNLLL